MRIVEFMEHVVGRVRRPTVMIEVYFGRGLKNVDINRLRAARPIHVDPESSEKWEFESAVTQMVAEIPLIEYHNIRRDLSPTSLVCKYHFYYDYFHTCLIFKRIDISDDGEDIYIVDGHVPHNNSIESVASLILSYMD